MVMDLKQIKELIKLLKESDITEIEVQEEVNGNRTRIKVNNTHAKIANAAVELSPSPFSTPSSTVSQNLASERSGGANAETGHTVKSPLVGTAYLAPSPGAKHFVTIGQSVKPGDVLCLIEAMKMFNKIEADRTGVVKEILVTNAQPVEFEQALFIIE
jgi:acetyl-CoA carboxylase biotin carboxyl carrier protein